MRKTFEGTNKMRKLDYYWATNRDWWEWKKNGWREIKPDAPKEAQESFKHYLEQLKDGVDKSE